MILDKVFLFIHKGKPSVLIADLKIIYSQSTELNCPVCRESKSGYVELNCGTDENKHKNCLNVLSIGSEPNQHVLNVVIPPVNFPSTEWKI